MAGTPQSSYAMFRPDLSEARLLSIAHRKAVELNAAQLTAHADAPQVRSATCSATPGVNFQVKFLCVHHDA